MQPGAEFFEDDAGLDHRHAGTVVFRRHEQAGGAQVGETAPDRLGGTGRVVEQRADMPGDRRLFGKKASHGVAQRDLLVGQLQVHDRGNPRTRWAVMFLLICVVPPAMVSERDVKR